MHTRFLLPLLILAASTAAGCASAPAQESESSQSALADDSPADDLPAEDGFVPADPSSSEHTSEEDLPPKEAVLAQNPPSSDITDAPELPFEYKCDSGTVIRAAYPTINTALIEYKGSVLKMEAAVSASGARYINSELTWWTKGTSVGSEGTLFENDGGETGDIIETCTQSNKATLQGSEAGA